jgi:hypothetical protein
MTVIANSFGKAIAVKETVIRILRLLLSYRVPMIAARTPYVDSAGLCSMQQVLTSSCDGIAPRCFQ